MTTTSLPEDRDIPEALGKRSTAQQLVELALDHYDLHVDTDGKPFGVRKGGHVAIPLLGSRRSVRKELGGMYRRRTARTASQNALTEAMSALEYEAEESFEPIKLHLRTARPSDDEIFIDIGDRSEQVIRVTAAGWEILDGDDDLPVLFRRTAVTAPLPVPARGGNLDALWEFVNLPASDRGLIIGWLVAATILVGLPCPALALLGEQGTAKTSSARRLFSLFDPTTAPVRRPPNDADRLLHAGAHSRGVVFDNMSSMPRWLSDGLCRFVTGEADVDRALYTDDDVRIMQVQGVLGFTSIDIGVLNGDLAERCVWGDLEVIPADRRRSERELNSAWNASYASMVGALLDLVVLTLQQLPVVKLGNKPRMADFAEILAALDHATGSDTLSRYRRAQDSVAEDIVSTDQFLVAITETIKRRWTGTGKALHELLRRPSDDRYWPEPRGMSGKLRRVAPDLRKAGWQIDEIKPDPTTKRSKTWVLVPPDSAISDADLASVKLTREFVAEDVRAWIARFMANGATASCATDHGSAASSGFPITCRTPGCTAGWRSEWDTPLQRSRALTSRLADELTALGISVADLDQYVGSDPFAPPGRGEETVAPPKTEPR